jgi:hypothetical protein
MRDEPDPPELGRGRDQYGKQLERNDDERPTAVESALPLNRAWLLDSATDGN